MKTLGAMDVSDVEVFKRITIRTHEACIRIIDKKGPLDNPADRDHCIQYMVAVPILFGRLTAGDYEDSVGDGPAHRRPARQNQAASKQALHPPTTTESARSPTR